jgi:hypothetical protein
MIRLTLLLTVIASLSITTTAAAQNAGWPAGNLVLSTAPDFLSPDCSIYDWSSPNDSVDVYLGARLDLASIDRADLNGSAGMTAWMARLNLQDASLIEVELFPVGAVDADPDPLNFDVQLGTALSGIQPPILLARLRLANVQPSTFLQWESLPESPIANGPSWSASSSTDDCPPPCTRGFRSYTAAMASIVESKLAGCWIDACFVAIDRPTGGEIWVQGSTQTILHSIDSPYRVEFSSDGGNSWETLDNGYSNPGFYHWTIPNIITDDARLRACGQCAFSECSEPVVFTITNKVAIEGSSWGTIKSRYGLDE